ncbi:unnamed protein product [Amoebophrya sp. A120]|nr:unnamed protein product [Amoebophrya sp. A120]|eukprot:GSA120T00017560001.1
MRFFTSFYLDCSPPPELKQAFQSGDTGPLEKLPQHTRTVLRRWLSKKFDLCANIRSLWHKRRLVEQLPTDRECLNEYYLEGAQNAQDVSSLAAQKTLLASVMNKMRPAFQGVTFVHEKDRGAWFKCCHVGHPAAAHPLQKRLSQAYTPFLEYRIRQLKKQLSDAKKKTIPGMEPLRMRYQMQLEKYSVAKTNSYLSLQCKRVDDPNLLDYDLGLTSSTRREDQADPLRSHEVCLRVQHKGFAEFGLYNDREKTQCIQLGLDEWPNPSRPDYFNLGRPVRYDFQNFKYLKERENYRVLFL